MSERMISAGWSLGSWFVVFLSSWWLAVISPFQHPELLVPVFAVISSAIVELIKVFIKARWGKKPALPQPETINQDVLGHYNGLVEHWRSETQRLMIELARAEAELKGLHEQNVRD